MTVSAHVQELRKKHAILSDEVDRAQRSPSFDGQRLKEMKRQKLHLKERITRLGE